MVLTVQIILGISLAGIIVILLRKIPDLAELRLEEEFSSSEIEPASVEDGVSDQATTSSFNNFLQKLLLRTKILNLKTENKISAWLEGLRQKNKKEDTGRDHSDDYWEQLKK